MALPTLPPDITLVKKLDTTLLLITNKARTAPLYVQFFGHQREDHVHAA
jgi:hypothetical protein